MPHRSILPLLLLALLAGCDERPGSVEGEAYLVLDMTHQQSLGKLRVHLVRDLPRLAELDSVLGRACPTRDDSTADRLRAPERWASAWDDRARVLAKLTTRVVATDPAAHFRIDSVPPGRYRLWADTTVDDTRWTWLVPVRVRGGQTTRMSLTNANPDENPFRCR